MNNIDWEKWRDIAAVIFGVIFIIASSILPTLGMVYSTYTLSWPWYFGSLVVSVILFFILRLRNERMTRKEWIKDTVFYLCFYVLFFVLICIGKEGAGAA